MKKAVYFFLLCLSGAALAACAVQTVQTLPERGLYVDSALSSLKNVQVNKVVDEGGICILQLEALNDSSRVVEGYRLVEWFDSNGIIIKSLDSRWLPFRIQGKARWSLKFVAPSPKAVTYRIQLKKNIK